MNRQKLLRFTKYFTMLFLSLSFVSVIIAVALTLSTLIFISLIFVTAAVSSIIAARDAGYIDLF